MNAGTTRRLARCPAVPFVLAALLVLPATGAGPGQALSAEQARELAESARKLAAETVASEPWFQTAETILGLGEAGRKVLLRAVSVKLPDLKRKYSQAFYAEAKRIRTEKLAEAAGRPGMSRRKLEAEILQARRDVLGLLKVGNLQKQQIVTTGDPAMSKLAQLTFVDRGEVLEGSEQLQTRREQFHKLVELRSRTAPAGQAPSDAENVLVIWERYLTLLALPINAGARGLLEANAAMAVQLAPEEAEGIADLNRIRLLLGLPAVAIDLKLCQAARGHSQDMHERKFFSHDSPVPGKATPSQRAKLAGTSGSAENIAAGTATGLGANKMWFHSPGHFKNMLGNHRRVGLGHHNKKWTQMFGR